MQHCYSVAIATGGYIMKHSVSEAAKLTGKNRTTIYRHMKNSVISFEKGSTGNPVIETSALERVYGSLHCNVAKQQTETPGDTVQVAVLQAQLDATKLMLQDAQKDRDDWKEQAQQAFMLLTNNPVISNETKIGDSPAAEFKETTQQPAKRKKSLLGRLLSAAISD